MKLKTWMTKNNVTTRSMAIRVGVCHTSISKYCNGERRPRYETAKKIVKITKNEVKLEDLMEK